METDEMMNMKKNETAKNDEMMNNMIIMKMIKMKKETDMTSM